MSKFKVGDKVRVSNGGNHLNTDNVFMEQFAPNLLDRWLKGKYYDTFGRTQDVLGTIIAVGNNEKVLVADESGEPFVIYECGLSLEQPRREFILIHCDGDNVVADRTPPVDGSPFDDRAKLAFDRLMGRQNIDEAIKAWNEPSPAPEPPKFYTGKVVCVEDGYPWSSILPSRTGKVFQFVNGFIVGKNKGEFTTYEPVRYVSFEHLCRNALYTKWIEIKE